VRYRGEFDPHGQVVMEWTNVSLNLSSRKFATYERDSATNLDYAQARMYHHNRARFMQPDPIGLKAANPKKPQSLNRYSYVRNDPVNYVDRSGTDLLWVNCKTEIFDSGRESDGGWIIWDAVTTCEIESVPGGREGGGGGGGQVDRNAEIDAAITRAEELLRNDRCRSFIERIAYEAFARRAGAQPTPDEERYIRENVTSIGALLSAVRGAQRNIQADNYDRTANAKATYGSSQGTIIFYRGFFDQRVQRDIIVNNEDKYYYVPRDIRERAQTLIHEGLHLLFQGASDALLGEIISGRAIKGDEETRRRRGSEIISAAITQNCG
jgi:RHS repeat-associated protein